MPDLVTHHYIGQSVYSRCHEDIQAKIDKSSFDAMTAGPDTFFFVSFLKSKINKESFAFGGYMHQNKTKLFLDSLIEKCFEEPALFGYLCGFLTHYYADSIIHPYVFHITGAYDEAKPNTLPYRGLHTLLERAIDSYMIETHYQCVPHRFKIHKHILTTQALPIELKKPLDDVFNKVYDCPNGFEKTNQSLVDQKKFYRFIYDPIGIKRWLLKKVDNGTSNLDLSVLSYYKRKIEDVDILNLKHRTWLNPMDSSIQSNESVLDLLDKAVINAHKTIEHIYHYVFNHQRPNYRIEDISYLSGLNNSQKQTMQYFNNIFEEARED